MKYLTKLTRNDIHDGRMQGREHATKHSGIERQESIRLSDANNVPDFERPVDTYPAVFETPWDAK